MLESSIDLKLPYVTRDLPGIGGQLRATPEDFLVEEIALYEPSGEGQHLYVNLTKEGLTTKDVQLQLERLFALNRGDVSFAGMKDKYARTRQTFSLNVGHRDRGFVAEAEQKIQERLPVVVHWAKFHKNKLRRGHLLGNRFAITVTELACGVSDAMQRGQAILQQLKACGVPNFFGPQRFGPQGDNIRQGLEILQQQRVKKDRWLRQFLISSYQSYLCNRYLVRRLEDSSFDHLLAGDVAKKYATGGMFDVLDVAVEQPRYAAQEISFTAPIFGSKMWVAQDAAGRLEAEVLAESPVTFADFERARVEGTRRLGRILAPDLQIRALPEAIVVEFSLPKGAFATTVLRELMKVDPGQMPEIDDADE